MKEITCANGTRVKVDDADYPELSQYRWQWTGRYAIRSKKVDGKFKSVYMHREILNPPAGKHADHIDHDTTNNQRANLRVATHRENMWNRSVQKNAPCGFAGVTPRTLADGTVVYYARIPGSNSVDGPFATAEDAARKFDETICRQRGPFASPNFGINEKESALRAFLSSVCGFSEREVAISVELFRENEARCMAALNRIEPRLHLPKDYKCLKQLKAA